MVTLRVALRRQESFPRTNRGSFTYHRYPPEADVMVTLTINDSNEGRFPNPTPGANGALRLNFTPANWDRVQIVTIAGHDDDIDDGNTNYMVSAALTFTPSNWNTAQTVTVTGVSASEDGEEATISHTIAGGDYAGIPVSAVEVFVNADGRI